MITTTEMKEYCEKYPFTVVEQLAKVYKNMSEYDKKIFMTFFNDEIKN